MVNCSEQKAVEEKGFNPAAEGFNVSESDSVAIKIADQIMEAMGGRKAWDQTRYISWTFFGRRELLWDKHQNRVRIENLQEPKDIFIVDLENMEGKVMIDDEIINHPDSLKKYLRMGKSIWINDSYWLCMPFKLKDTGVTLKYAGNGRTNQGKTAHILELTFKDVGDTPQNKYRVWVDQETNLITQWAYYRNADQDTANFVREWDNYKNYGGIMLSGDREQGGPGDIHVYESVPETAFNSLEPISLEEDVK